MAEFNDNTMTEIEKPSPPMGNILSNAKWVPLSQLPTMDEASGDVTAVIETPKGSPNKYDYDEDHAAFRLAGVMPEGTTFPYDFGFLPSTVAEDGDPLDVLVFLDAPVVVGCVLTVRLIGVIEAKQRKKGEQWIRNDRLLAVATHAHTHQHVETLDDLRPHLVDEIEAFFQHYNAMKGSDFKPVNRGGPKKARKLLDQAHASFQKKHAQRNDGQ
jgi:inorganic pyrophosphatase